MTASFNLADLGMRILAVARTVSGGKALGVLIELEVDGDRGRCLVGPRGGSLTAEVVAGERARRDGRIVAIEAIGGALSSLRRLDHVWYDEDVREILSQVRASLARSQSTIKERLDK